MRRLLNLMEMAQVLAKKPKTLYNYLEAGKFPTAFKIGHEWRIEEEDLWDVEIARMKKNNGLDRETA